MELYIPMSTSSCDHTIVYDHDNLQLLEELNNNKKTTLLHTCDVLRVVSNPMETAQFIYLVKEYLEDDSTKLSMENAKEIAMVMNYSPYTEVPILLWSLISKNTRAMFLVLPHIKDIILEKLTGNKIKKEQQLSYMLNAIRRKRRDEKDIKDNSNIYPVHFFLVDQGILMFSSEEDRYIWSA